MTVLAYFHIGTTIIFFAGMIVNMREQDEEKKSNSYFAMFIMLVVMTLSGLGLALGTLGLLPTIHW